MEKELFLSLAQYNKSVNEDLCGVLNTLAQDEWNRQFSGFFKSIHEICSHIYVSDYNWLKRFTALHPFKSVAPAFFAPEITFQEVLFSTVGEYAEKRSELDEVMLDFVNELTPRDFDSVLRYTNYKGKAFEKKAAVVLLHIFNHETHHRGMIAAYLDSLGIENDYSALTAKI